MLEIRTEPSVSIDGEIMGTLHPGFILDAEESPESELWLKDENGYFYLKELVEEADRISDSDTMILFDYNRNLHDIPQEIKESAGANVTIAVFDTGCMPHPAINNRIICFYDATSKQELSTYIDDTGHGTFVTGLICSNGNNSNIIGLAPKVQIIVVKCSKQGRFFSDYFYNGLKWLIEESSYSPDIINMSFSCAYSRYKKEIQNLIEVSHDQSIIMIAAGQDDEKLFHRRRPFYPAFEKHVLAVGAIQKDFILESDQVMDGIDYVVPRANDYESIYQPGSFFQKRGCSFATAMISGAMALTKSYQQGANSPDDSITVQNILNENLPVYDHQQLQSRIKIYRNENNNTRT